jgi:transposase
VALEPLLNAIESLSERIVEYNERIEKLAQASYPRVALLKQIKGVGTLIALTFWLTLEDPHRFRKSRDVGCYLGLCLMGAVIKNYCLGPNRNRA